jgi:hypothetical protein
MVKFIACVGLPVDVLVVSVYRWVWVIIILRSALVTRKKFGDIKGVIGSRNSKRDRLTK